MQCPHLLAGLSVAVQAAGDEGSIAAAGEPDAGTVGCRSHLTAWIALFAVLQLGLSQIPKFEHLW